MGDSAQTQAGASAASAPETGSNWGAMSMTAMGGLVSANAQYQTGKVNKHIANANAQIAEVQRDQALSAGAYTAGKVAMHGRQIESTQAAAQAGGGTVVGAGTNRAVLDNTEQASSMDALMIQRNASREALGYQLKADADRMQGDQAMATGKMGAMSSLLNTGSQMWLESDTNYRGYKAGGIRV